MDAQSQSLLLQLCAIAAAAAAIVDNKNNEAASHPPLRPLPPSCPPSNQQLDRHSSNPQAASSSDTPRVIADPQAGPSDAPAPLLIAPTIEVGAAPSSLLMPDPGTDAVWDRILAAHDAGDQRLIDFASDYAAGCLFDEAPAHTLARAYMIDPGRVEAASLAVVSLADATKRLLMAPTGTDPVWDRIIAAHDAGDVWLNQFVAGYTRRFVVDYEAPCVTLARSYIVDPCLQYLIGRPPPGAVSAEPSFLGLAVRSHHGSCHPHAEGCLICSVQWLEIKSNATLGVVLLLNSTALESFHVQCGFKEGETFFSIPRRL